MKKTRTYIFDALVNLIVQSVLFFIGMFVWVNPVYEVIWALAAAGFAAFLAFMERGAEKRSGADFRHYLMFSVLPVNIIALIVAAVRGAAFGAVFRRPHKLIKPRPLSRTDRHNRYSQQLLHAADVYFHAALRNYIHHVKRKHHRFAQLNQLQRKIQTPLRT